MGRITINPDNFKRYNDSLIPFAESGSMPTIETYMGYVNPNQFSFENYASGKLNEIAATNQPTINKLGNELYEFLPNVAFGVTGGVGRLAEIPNVIQYATGQIKAEEMDFSNALVEWADERKARDSNFYSKELGEVSSIYKPEFWLKHGTDVLESVAEFAIPASGVSKVSSLATKGLKIAKYLDASAGAVSTAYMEGAMTGANIYKNTLDEGTKKLDERIAKGEQFNYEDELSKIKQSAGENAAQATTIATVANSLLNFGSMEKLLGREVTEGLLKKNSYELAEQLAKKKNIPLPQALKEINAKSFRKDFLSQETLKETGKEALEENITGYAEQYFQGKALSDLGYKEYQNPIESLGNYLTSNEAAMNTLLGGLGGAGFNLASSLTNQSEALSNFLNKDSYSKRNSKVGIAVENMVKDQDELLKFVQQAKQEESNITKLDQSIDNLNPAEFNKSSASAIVDMIVRNQEMGTSETLKKILQESEVSDEVKKQYVELFDIAKREYIKGSMIHGENTFGAEEQAKDAIANKLFENQDALLTSDLGQAKQKAITQLHQNLNPIIERINKEMPEFETTQSFEDSPNIKPLRTIPLDTVNAVNQAMNYIDGKPVAFPELLNQIKPELDAIINDQSKTDIQDYLDVKRRKDIFDETRTEYNNRPKKSKEELTKRKDDWWKSKKQEEAQKAEKRSEESRKEEKAKAPIEDTFDEEVIEETPEIIEEEEIEIKPISKVKLKKIKLEDPIILENEIIEKEEFEISNRKTSSLTLNNNWFLYDKELDTFGESNLDIINLYYLFKYPLRDGKTLYFNVDGGEKGEENIGIYLDEQFTKRIGAVPLVQNLHKHLAKTVDLEVEQNKLQLFREAILNGDLTEVVVTEDNKKSGGYLLSTKNPKPVKEATHGKYIDYDYYYYADSTWKKASTSGSENIKTTKYLDSLGAKAKGGHVFLKLKNAINEDRLYVVSLNITPKTKDRIINTMESIQSVDDPNWKPFEEFFRNLIPTLTSIDENTNFEDAKNFLIEKFKEINNPNPNIPFYFVQNLTQEINGTPLLEFFNANVYFQGQLIGDGLDVCYYQNPVLTLTDSFEPKIEIESQLPKLETLSNSINPDDNINFYQGNNGKKYLSYGPALYHSNEVKLDNKPSVGINRNENYIFYSDKYNVAMSYPKNKIIEEEEGLIKILSLDKEEKNARTKNKRQVLAQILIDEGFSVNTSNISNFYPGSVDALFNEGLTSGLTRQQEINDLLRENIEKAIPQQDIFIAELNNQEDNVFEAPDFRNINFAEQVLDKYHVVDSFGDPITQHQLSSVIRSLSNVYVTYYQKDPNNATNKIIEYLEDLRNKNQTNESLFNYYTTYLNNIDKLESLIISDLSNKGLIKESEEEQQEEIENNVKDDFSDDSNLKVKLVDTLSNKAKIFLSAIPKSLVVFQPDKEQYVKSEGYQYLFGLPEFVDQNQFLNYLFAHLPSNIKSKEQLIKELNVLGSVGVGECFGLAERLEKAPSDIIKELLKILNNANVTFIQTTLNTTSDDYMGEEITSSEFKINQLNKNIESKLLIESMTNSIKELYFDEEGNFIESSYNEALKTFSKNATIDNLIRSFEKIGITNLSEQKVQAIAQYAKTLKTQKGRTRFNKNSDIQTLIKNVFESINRNNRNPFGNSRNYLNELLPLITVLGEHPVNFTVRSAGNPIQSKVRYNFLTRFFNMLKTNQQEIMKQWNVNPFSRDNFLYKLFRDEKLGASELKRLTENSIFRTFKNREDGSDNESELKDFSPKEREFNNVKLLMNETSGLFLLPTLSDKGTLPALKRFPFDLSNGYFKPVFNNIILPEIRRIKEISEFKGEIIEGYHNGAGNFFLMFDFLNNVNYKEKPLYEYIKDISLEDISKDQDLMDEIQNEVFLYYGDKAFKKLQYWKSLGLDLGNLDFAKQYEILYDLHHSLFRQLTFDPAYAGVKAKSFIKLFANPNISPEEKQQLLISGNKEVWDEVGKRNAAIIAPGDFAIYDNNKYYSFIIKDPKGEVSELGYEDIDVADAQEYTTYREHLRVYKALGKITNEQYVRSLQAFYRGVNPINIVLQPLKPVYAGLDEQGNFHYIKTSSFPLLPSMNNIGLNDWRIRFEETETNQIKDLERYGELMEKDKLTKQDVEEIMQIENSIKTVRVAFKTGKKLGANKRLLNPEDITNLNSNDLLTYANELDRDFFLYQLEISEHNKEAITQGSQEEIQILSDLNPEMESVKNEYIKVMNQITDVAMERFDENYLDSMGSVRLTSLENALKDEIKNRNLGDNALSAVDVLEDGSLFFTPLFRKLEPILLNLVNKEILDLKMTGTSGVLGSEYKVERINEDRSEGIHFLSSFSGSMNHNEIIIPFPFGSTLKEKHDNWNKLQNGSFNVPKEFNEVYGFRIPGSGPQSIRDLTVVGYTNPILGSLTIPNKSLIVSMGSDFDVDKLNIYWKAHKINEGGIEIIKDESLLGLQNKALDLRLQLIRTNDSKFDILGIGQFGDLEVLRNKNEVKPQGGFSSSYQQDLFKNGQSGKLGVASYSLGITAIVKAQLAKLSLNKPILFKFNGEEFPVQSLSDYLNINGIKRSSVLSALQNLAVDNAKLGKLNGLNLNKFTFDLSIFLATLGLTEEQIVSYITSPMIKDYVRVAEERSDSFGSGYYDLNSTINDFLNEKGVIFDREAESKKTIKVNLGNFDNESFSYKEIVDSEDLIGFAMIMFRSDQYKSLMSNVRQRSKKAGGTISQNKIISNNYESAVNNDSSPFANVPNLFDKNLSFYPNLQSPINKVESYFQDYISNIKPQWSTISKSLIEELGTNVTEDLLNEIDNGMTTFIIKENIPLLSETLEVNESTNIKSLYDRIPKSKLNKFFNQLSFINSGVEWSDGLKSDKMIAVIDGGYLRDEANNYYLDFLDGLMNEDEDIRNFSNHLLVHVLSTNPDYYSPVSLYQFIPTAYLGNLELVNGRTFYQTLNDYAENENSPFSNFQQQFLISNPRRIPKDGALGITKKGNKICVGGKEIRYIKTAKNQTGFNYQEIKYVPTNGSELFDMILSDERIEITPTIVAMIESQREEIQKVQVNMDANKSEFNSNLNIININKSDISFNPNNLLEELYHALTVNKLTDEKVNEIHNVVMNHKDQIIKLVEEYKGSDKTKLNVLFKHRLEGSPKKVVAELLASSLLNEPLQDIFKQIKLKDQTLFDKLKTWISELFGPRVAETLGDYLQLKTVEIMNDGSTIEIERIKTEFKIC